MATAKEVKVAGGKRNRGEFRCESFNIFLKEDREQYADLRTRANDASSGIDIELVREYSRKNTYRDGDGNVTTEEDIILVVHFWEKKPRKDKGDSDDEVRKAKEDFGLKRNAG